MAGVFALALVAVPIPMVANDTEETVYSEPSNVDWTRTVERAERRTERRVALPSPRARVGIRERVRKMPDVEVAVQYALAQLGKPYEWGKTGPDSFDCSGLMMAAFRHAGVKISRTTFTQIRDGRAVSRTELRRGDLVFPDPGHVQLYLGEGKVIHSPNSRSVVRINNIGKMFYAARRIIEGGSTVQGGLSLVSNVGSPIGELDSAIEKITDPALWLRVLMILVGFVLLVLAGLPIVDSAREAVSA